MDAKWWIINGLILAIVVILSFTLGLATGVTRRKKYDGTLLIGTVHDEERGEDRDQYHFIFTTEMEDLAKQAVLIMKIEHSQNSQPI